MDAVQVATTEFLNAQISALQEALGKKDDLIRNLEMRVENLNNSINNTYVKEKNLRDYLAEHGEEMELFAEDIANIFDIPLTKEVEFEATITVSGTVEVPLFGDIDIEDLISENIYVDANHGDITVGDYSVDHVSDIS